MNELFNNLLTPQEILQMRAELEQQYGNANLMNQSLNTSANMAKNLSPMANLGIMLGTLGGMWGANRLNDIWQKNTMGANNNPNNNPPSNLYQFKRQYSDWRQPQNYPNVLNVQSDFYKPFLANMQKNFLTPYNPNS